MAWRLSARMLIVDTDCDVAATLCELLARDGHEVTIAGTAQEASAAVAARQFDVILAEPVIARSSLPKHAPVVGIATAGELPEDFRPVVPRRVLHKPFRLADVRDALQEVFPAC